MLNLKLAEDLAERLPMYIDDCIEFVITDEKYLSQAIKDKIRVKAAYNISTGRSNKFLTEFRANQIIAKNITGRVHLQDIES